MQPGVIDLTHVGFEGTAGHRARRGAGPLVRPLPPRRPARAHPDSCPSPPLDEFPRWVLEQAGIDVALYRPTPLNRRVPACLRALHMPSAAAARDLLRREPRLLDPAVTALLVGVTGFFRDEAVFAALRRHVIPALAARGGQVRAWSAACSSGQEVYSLAILLAEAGVLHRCRLLGTDCRPDAVAQAEAALYRTDALASLPPDLLNRYFTRRRNGWQPHARIRSRTEWQVRSCAAESPRGPWDIVLWRNAAIYMQPKETGRIVSRLASTLRPGGFLVVGKAERPPADVRLVPISSCIYRRGGDANVS